MKIQNDVKEMTKALVSYFEEGKDSEIAEEVAYHLSEINEVAERYQQAFRRLAAARNPAQAPGEAARLLEEMQALIFEKAIVHAKDLRRPAEELHGMLEEDDDSCPGGGA